MAADGRVLFLQHQADAPAGHFGERAEERGLDSVTVTVGRGPIPDPTGFDLVVPLGSGASAYDPDVHWIPEELAVLRRAVGADVPVLGVCFGAQLLSVALGGSVRRAPTPTIGWYKIETDVPGLVEPGPWVVWHFDVLTPPRDAVELARTPAATQAFVAGPHTGIQFHPEATADSVTSWAATYADAIIRLGRRPEDLVAETRVRAGEARRAAHRLFDRLYDRAQAERSPTAG